MRQHVVVFLTLEWDPGRIFARVNLHVSRLRGVELARSAGISALCLWGVVRRVYKRIGLDSLIKQQRCSYTTRCCTLTTTDNTLTTNLSVYVIADITAIFHAFYFYFRLLNKRWCLSSGEFLPSPVDFNVRLPSLRKFPNLKQSTAIVVFEPEQWGRAAAFYNTYGIWSGVDTNADVSYFQMQRRRPTCSVNEKLMRKCRFSHVGFVRGITASRRWSGVAIEHRNSS